MRAYDAEVDEPRFPLLEELGPLDTWVLNTYAGCDIRCRYCITAAQGTSYPRASRREMRSRLGQELETLDERVGLPAQLAVGSYADVYPNVEADYGVTRPALAVLVERHIQFTLVTKGRTVLRDVDLLADDPNVHVQVSLCSVDEDAVAKVDPGAPTVSERLHMIRVLRNAGVRVRVQASPWIPGVSDVAALLERLDPTTPVTVTPLRIPPHVVPFARARGLTQATVNEAFRREYERVGPRPHVVWSRPPALDGAPPHIRDNIGRPTIGDWTAADAAPNIGPAREEQLVRLRPARRALRARYARRADASA
jgi:DNA repair photolyase